MNHEAWMYVLSDSTQPLERQGQNEPEVVEPESLAKIGIIVRQVEVLVRHEPALKKPVTSFRFAIILDGGREDDEFAQRFVDAYFGAFALIREPVEDSEGRALRAALTRQYVHRVEYSDLVRWNPDKLDYIDSLDFMSTTCISRHYFALVWDLLPVLLRDPYLAASHYLNASFRDFYSLGVARAEALGEDTYIPSSQRQFTSFESCLQNAYKVVEALIGEPPNDDRALREKLEAVGVDPMTLIDAHWSPKSGYCEYLLETVKSMHRARDKRAAHVRTPNREPLSYTELSLFQQCAWVMLRDAVEREPEIELLQEEQENDV